MTGGRPINGYRGSGRGATFGYLTDPNPPMIAAVMRLVLAGHLGVALPALAMVLFPGTVLDWPRAGLAAGIFVASILMGATELRRAEHPSDPKIPPASVAIAHLVVLTAAVSTMNAAIVDPAGWYAVALLVPAILGFLIGRPGFAVTILIACGIGFALSSAAVDLYPGSLLAATVGFALVVGGVGMMIAVLSTSMVKSQTNMLNLVHAGATAARAETIERGLAEIATLIRSAHIGGTRPERVDVFRVGIATGERLGHNSATWHPAEQIPDRRLVDEAVLARGVATDRDRAVLVSDVSDGGRIVIEIEVPVTTNLEHHAVRFDLDRYALHLGLLVQRLAAIDELNRLGQTDSLTGLPNRRALLKRLEQESETTNPDPRLVVAMIDLDDFKAYNDRYGHPEGDRLLADVASMLQQRVRGSDLVSRYGGEEFCLVLPSTNEAGAQRLLDELHTWAALLRPGEPITFSAGVARWDGAEPTTAVVGRADQALYQAKAEGKNRTIVAPPLADDPASTGDTASTGRSPG